ncbi:uncharacterized protein ARB_01740 [Trichophyton benhamiae CBS 112371]|uniref:Transmembrane protein n=1 Tax=Arthroderma benhamiae (strain ATCC MYA-4681 / CBS 112371) TaxID=663331 RepID=D4AZX0_ARTBC|nr:uncharacterized protein ARB_01740 [Trichophyton benhamiae CBS 112371]EFE31345.1 hypothetical protein ARB_01740 [Trichophyton benhamiae CBS 112371]
MLYRCLSRRTSLSLSLSRPFASLFLCLFHSRHDLFFSPSSLFSPSAASLLWDQRKAGAWAVTQNAVTSFSRLFSSSSIDSTIFSPFLVAAVVLDINFFAVSFLSYQKKKRSKIREAGNVTFMTVHYKLSHLHLKKRPPFPSSSKSFFFFFFSSLLDSPSRTSLRLLSLVYPGGNQGTGTQKQEEAKADKKCGLPGQAHGLSRFKAGMRLERSRAHHPLIYEVYTYT